MISGKNLRNFLRSHPLIFISISAAQIVAIIILMFSYGIYINSKQEINASNYEGQKYSVEFNVSENANPENAAKLKKVLPEILDCYSGLIESCSVESVIPCEDADGNYDYSSREDNIYFRTFFTFEDGRYKNLEIIPEKYLEGRKLSDDDENGNQPVCVVTRSVAEKTGDKVRIGDVDYEVVGVENFGADGEYETYEYIKMVEYFKYEKALLVPFRQIPENATLMNVEILFDRVITVSEYKYINGIFGDAFGSDILSLPAGHRVDYDEEKVFQSMIFIVLILGCLAAHSMVGVYGYILKKREKQTGIFLVCGARKQDIVKAYVLEMSVQLLFFSCIGYFLFQKLLRRKLDLRYKWFYSIFVEEIDDCVKLLAIFIAIVICITSVNIIRIVKKSPISIIKKN